MGGLVCFLRLRWRWFRPVGGRSDGCLFFVLHGYGPLAFPALAAGYMPLAGDFGCRWLAGLAAGQGGAGHQPDFCCCMNLCDYQLFFSNCLVVVVCGTWPLLPVRSTYLRSSTSDAVSGSPSGFFSFPPSRTVLLYLCSCISRGDCTYHNVFFHPSEPPDFCSAGTRNGTLQGS